MIYSIEESELFSNGHHMLSGVSNFIHKGCDDGMGDGVIIVLDDKIYSCYEDPDDGYRSYSIIRAGVPNNIEKKCTNIFPPQPVNVQFEEHYNIWDCKITNKDGDLILRVGTDELDDYYPTAIFEYHPENLPINKSNYE